MNEITQCYFTEKSIVSQSMKLDVAWWPRAASGSELTQTRAAEGAGRLRPLPNHGHSGAELRPIFLYEAKLYKRTCKQSQAQGKAIKRMFLGTVFKIIRVNKWISVQFPWKPRCWPPNTSPPQQDHQRETSWRENKAFGNVIWVGKNPINITESFNLFTTYPFTSPAPCFK